MENIAIHDADEEHLSKHRRHKLFPNYALMKISAYHKNKGDTVEWWNPLCKYDKVYSSKIFDFTPENPYLPEDTIKGGTGYRIFKNLPDEIDKMLPDYSIYPECDFAVGFLTRGCLNKCSWCVVPKKEGNIQPYRTWQEIVRTDTNKLLLMDNNILACQHGIEQLKQLADTDYRIDLNQGMDIRLLTDEICEIISKIKWLRYIRFSCDTKSQLPYFEKAVEMFNYYKIPKSRIFIYTLVRKDLSEADERVHKLHSLCRSFNIYAQAERNEFLGIVPNKMQLEFAQRYVYGRCYKKESWDEYCKRKNFEWRQSKYVQEKLACNTITGGNK